MSQAAANKPAPTEHAPEFSKYVTLVTEDDIIQTLEQQLENSLSLLRTIPSDKGQLPLRPREVERQGTVGPSYRFRSESSVIALYVLHETTKRRCRV